MKHLASVDKVKHNKAAGEDGLVSTYVKETMKGVEQSLLDIFRGHWRKPEEWKRANVTHIFKKGAKGNPANIVAALSNRLPLYDELCNRTINFHYGCLKVKTVLFVIWLTI